MFPYDQHDLAVVTIFLLIGIWWYSVTLDGPSSVTVVLGLWAAYLLGSTRPPK